MLLRVGEAVNAPPIGRLRAEVDAEIAEYGFRIRDLNKLVARQCRFLEQAERDLERLRSNRKGGEAEANSS